MTDISNTPSAFTVYPSLTMRMTSILFVLALLASTAIAQEKKPMMKKLTPVIVVEQIEPCLSFWLDHLGFQKTAEVPDGDKLGFVILVKGNVEIMYQTKASVAKDVPALANQHLNSSTGLYIEVEKLDPVIDALKGIEFVVPPRKTFYGAREVGVREPGGSLVMFAEFAPHE
jgi:uncharacterized glyoxalase superfamily protein PhnB